MPCRQSPASLSRAPCPRRAASISMTTDTQAKTVRVGILGASGYTGAELVRLLLGHRNVEITALTGNTQAGQDFCSVYPQFHYAKVMHPKQSASTKHACSKHPSTRDVINDERTHMPNLKLHQLLNVPCGGSSDTILHFFSWSVCGEFP